MFQAIAAGQTPEPSSVAVLGAAATGLLSRRRRRANGNKYRSQMI
jgi:hypothetical protein